MAEAEAGKSISTYTLPNSDACLIESGSKKSSAGDENKTNAELNGGISDAQPQLSCPRCGSTKLYKDGLRYLKMGSSVQRWLCRNCGYRFSETNPNKPNKFQHAQKIQRQILNSSDALLFNCQGSCEALSGAPTGQHRLVQTLVEVESRIGEAQREGTRPDAATIKGKVLEFAWYLKKKGRKQTTIKTYISYLNTLIENGVNAENPEAVKDFLATAPWKDASKHTFCHLYTTFLKFLGKQWEQPSYYPTRKLPFIPTEDEIDQFVAASGKKLAAALQIAKETAMRVGEIAKLKWTDIDFEKGIIFCNSPEKNCEPGVYKISQKLISMLNMLPREREYIFGPSPRNLKTLMYYTRKKILRKLCETRLASIGFHTLRHWKATKLYHETKNPLLVKEFLRHRNLDSTLIYIQLEKSLYQDRNDNFIVMATKNPEEIKALLEVGFDYVCQKDDLVFLRKRK